MSSFFWYHKETSYRKINEIQHCHPFFSNIKKITHNEREGERERQPFFSNIKKTSYTMRNKVKENVNPFSVTRRKHQQQNTEVGDC